MRSRAQRRPSVKPSDCTIRPMKDATRCLDQLRQEKEQKNLLKDELTHVLRAQQAQEVQLNEYKSMVKNFQSSKRDLTFVSKAGRRGGGHWPL